MIDDLLTMSEIIQCVADMRTQDVKAIREFGKFVPAFAAFEKNRLSLYREAAKEAKEIFDRWADEIDDLDAVLRKMRTTNRTSITPTDMRSNPKKGAGFYRA